MTVAPKGSPSSTERRAAERLARWRRLAQLLDRIDRAGLRRLDAAELEELGRLYRRVAADLSQARTLELDDATIRYLNDLTGRAYGHVYVTPGKGAPSLLQFFTREFPRAFRHTLPLIGAAAATFSGALLLAWVLTLLNPDYAEILLGPGASALLDEIASRHRGGEQDWIPSEIRPLASSGIMTNNIRVAIAAFALGIVACLGTLFIMFYNGLLIGVVGAAVQQEGVAYGFWAFVAPHGVLELPAIFIAGGAGLLLGLAVLNPGDYPRRVAIRLAAQQAVVLVLGVAAMLVVAAVIEGFFSPALLPLPVKYGFAAVLLVGEVCYFAFAGRGGPREERPRFNPRPRF